MVSINMPHNSQKEIIINRVKKRNENELDRSKYTSDVNERQSGSMRQVGVCE